MDTIISKSNEKVKYLKSLNEKKFRQKYKAFYLEGIKVVTEILENKAIDILFIAYSKELLKKAAGGDNLLSKIQNIKDNNIKIIETNESIFEYLVETKSPQGVIAVLKQPEYDINDFVENVSGDLLILDQVQDLGNIGTIIRSSLAFGIKNIIATANTADVYSPKVIRSTMGAITKVNFIYIPEEEIISIFNRLKNHGYNIYGTTLDSSSYITEISFKNQKNVFILGNEANGISKKVINLCDKNIKIPIENNMESLNVSVAASIILYKNYIDKNF